MAAAGRPKYQLPRSGAAYSWQPSAGPSAVVLPMLDATGQTVSTVSRTEGQAVRHATTRFTPPAQRDLSQHRASGSRQLQVLQLQSCASATCAPLAAGSSQQRAAHLLSRSVISNVEARTGRTRQHWVSAVAAPAGSWRSHGVIGSGALAPQAAGRPATRGISMTGVLADSVKRKRQTMMKKHKWKKRRKLLRRKSKASQGASK